MCLLKPPFDANSLPALALKILKGEYAPAPKQYSKGLRQLISEMMQLDPAKRPTISEVLANPLLRDKAGFMRFKDRN
jgi:serine/threonine protein kinase